MPIERERILGVIAEKKRQPNNIPNAAGNKISLSILQSAFFRKRRNPTKSIAIKSGNKIARASLMLDWLAINGNESTPKPAPNPLLEIPTIKTLIAANTKKIEEWSVYAWTKEIMRGLLNGVSWRLILELKHYEGSHKKVSWSMKPCPSLNHEDSDFIFQ